MKHKLHFFFFKGRQYSKPKDKKEKEEHDNCRDIWHAALYLMYKFLVTESRAKFSFKKPLTFLVRKALKKNLRITTFI